MERGGKMIGTLLSVLALTVGAQAIRSFGASSDDPYRAIVDRNVFDLRPMPEKTTPAPPPTPPPNVKLVGLLMITGHPQAVLSIADPTAPSKPPATYILAEEERRASVEVKSINMDAQTARVDISGDVVQLKLEVMKAPPAGPAPAGPAMAGAPGQGRFMPGARAGGRGAFPVPVPGGPAAQPASYQPSVSPDSSGLPTRPVRTDTGDAAQPALTPEQSLAQMEQMRNLYQQNNDIRAQLLPPNPYAPQQPQATPDTGPGPTQPNTPPTTPTGPQLPSWAGPKSHNMPPMP